MKEKLEKPKTTDRRCVAFAGQTFVASGALSEVAWEAKKILDEDSGLTVMVLDAETSEPVEVDFRGTANEVVARLMLDPDGICNERSAAPGRPKLGVIAREVTLLPRHWQWLNEQPGGASVNLRKLVEEARRATAGEVQLRGAREACYRFMTTMAGNEPGYEEALRALFSGDVERLDAFTEEWPPDVRDHARRLAAGSLTSS